MSATTIVVANSIRQPRAFTTGVGVPLAAQIFTEIRLRGDVARQAVCDHEVVEGEDEEHRRDRKDRREQQREQDPADRLERGRPEVHGRLLVPPPGHTQDILNPFIKEIVERYL